MFNHANQIIGEEENVHILFTKQVLSAPLSTQNGVGKDGLCYKIVFQILKKALLDLFSVCDMYRAFHSFGQAKIVNGGFVLGLSQFPVLPQLPYKIMLGSNKVKMESKIII